MHLRPANFSGATIEIKIYDPLKFISEKLMIVLRDGRTLIGYLRTVDQFGLFIDLVILYPCYHVIISY